MDPFWQVIRERYLLLWLGTKCAFIGDKIGYSWPPELFSGGLWGWNLVFCPNWTKFGLVDTFCHTIRYRNLVLRLGTEYGTFGPQNDFLGVYGDKNLVYCLQLSGNPSHFQGIPAASKGSMQLLGGPCCFQGAATASKGSMPLSGGFYRFQGVLATPRGSLLHPEGHFYV